MNIQQLHVNSLNASTYLITIAMPHMDSSLKSITEKNDIYNNNYTRL